MRESSHVDSAEALDREAGLGCLLVVGTIIVVTMLDLANYLTEILPALLPKYIYLLEMIAIVGVMLTSARLSLFRIRLSIVAFVVVLLLVNILHGLFYEVASGLEEAQAVPWTRAQYLLLGLGIAMVTTALSRRQLATIFLFCGFVLGLSVLFDLAFPEVLYPWTVPGVVPGRPGSFLINANKPAEVLVLCGLLAMPVLRPRVALILVMSMGLGIFATFSRTGMVAWIILVMIYWRRHILTRTQIVGIGAVASVLVASGGLLVILIESQDLPLDAVKDISNRINFLSTGNLQDDSAQSRGFVLQEGIKLFFQHPLTGAGAGATHYWEYDVAPHNFLVLMSAEYGVIGVAAWLSLLGMLLSGCYFDSLECQAYSAGFLVLFTMSTHNILDFPYWLVGLFILSMTFAPPDPRRSLIAIGGGMMERSS